MFLASCSELFLLEWYDLQRKNHRRKIVLLTSQQHWQQRPQQLQRCHLCISHLSCAWRVLYIPRPYLKQFPPMHGNRQCRFQNDGAVLPYPSAWFMIWAVGSTCHWYIGIRILFNLYTVVGAESNFRAGCSDQNFALQTKLQKNVQPGSILEEYLR